MDINGLLDVIVFVLVMANFKIGFKMKWVRNGGNINKQILIALK